MSALTQIGLFDVPVESPQPRSLWDHQQAGYDGLKDAVRRGYRRPLLQVATGGGKTQIAARMITNSLKKGKRSVFAVPRKTLIKQTIDAFRSEGIEHIGVIQAHHYMTDWEAPVQVASIQTLVRRPLPEADLIFIDEAHLRNKELYKRLDSDQWKDKVIIALSATPWSKGLGRKWDELVIAGTTQELIDNGVLCPYQIMVPADEFKPNESHVSVKNGEFEDESAIAELSQPKLTANVVDTWLEHGPGFETFLFAQNCAHARTLQQEFIDRGINCGYIDGESTEEEVEDMWLKYESHEYKVIASVECLVAGVDRPVLCVILDFMTKSKMKYMQIIGRGLRSDKRYPDKVLLILDHGDNTRLRTGEPVDIHYDHLDMSKPGEKGEAYKDAKEPPKPRECPRCNLLVRQGMKSCPRCGMPFSEMKKNPRCDIESVDGELVLLGSGKKAKKQEYTVEQKREWYAGLLYLARKLGKSDGLAWHRFENKFGHFPAGYSKIPAVPSPEIEKWDRSQTIRYVKGKQKAERSAPTEEYHAAY